MADNEEKTTPADTETEAGEEQEASEAEAESDVTGPIVEAQPTEEAAAEPVPAGETAPVEAGADVETAAPRAEQAETPTVAPGTWAKRKRKRLPRALRRQRTKPRREKPKERKTIVRLPKPEAARGRRQVRQGVVVSAAMDKTIVVRVDLVKAHPVYKKVVRRGRKLHAHDEANEAKVGDVVRIVETRPLSRMKRWRLQRIVEVAK